MQPPGTGTPPDSPLPAPSSSTPTVLSEATSPVSQQEQIPQQSSDSSATSAPHVEQPAAPPPGPVQPRHTMTTRSRNNITKPATKYNLAATVECNPHWIPSTWQQAMKHAHWRKAMSSEFTSKTDNYTWDLVEVTQRINVVGCRWVFTIKYNPDGSIDKYKARIVAKGYHQQQGVDYTDTFSPVIKATTIRLILGLAVNCDWPVRQIDVNTAFLQGHLKEEVFMSQPPGFQDLNNPTHVCRLTKAIYGLKQTPRAWYSELKSFLLSIGFGNSLSDTSLFILNSNGTYVYLLVYVDDILVTGTSPALVQRIIDTIAKKFSIKDMGNLGYFLGIEAIRTPQGLHLMQRKYITDFLTKVNMLNAKPVATPLPSSPKLTQKSGTPISDPHEYRKIVGSLQYLALTWPASPMPSTSFLSICTARRLITGKLRNVSYVTCLALYLMEFFSAKKNIQCSMPSPTPTGLVTPTILSLPTHMSFIMVVNLSLGHQRS